MSYQLLYHLLTGAASPNGDAAERVILSEAMPEALRNRLFYNGRVRLSDRKGAQFSYTTVEAQDRLYHVLTRVSPGEAGIHRVHHLVLTPTEAGTLCRSEARFTPAGVMLCLLRAHFWDQDDEVTAAAVGEQPDINNEALPDASVQPTWKRLTGHKSQADLLNHAPYDRRCVLTVAESCPLGDILQLLHESTWLSATCGWGLPFTTSADSADLDSSMRCLVCGYDSIVVQKARSYGWPVLQVRETDRTITPTTGYRPPYTYTEEREDLFYPVRPQHLCRLFIHALAVLLVLSAALAVWFVSHP